MSADVATAVERILEARRAIPAERSTLVAVSGIDGAGKGVITTRIAGALEAHGLRAALISADGWLNLPEVRFADSQPAENFYRRAIRFEDMFSQLVLPLRDKRSWRVEADFAEETATIHQHRIHEFVDIDVILLDGIYLLKREFIAHYDVSFWIECAFETALARAVARAQEGLSPDATVEAYRRIYFPAQQIHFDRDQPQRTAHAVIMNDDDLRS